MQEEKHLDEVGIATLTACFVNANRDPKKGKSVNPDDFFYFRPTILSDTETLADVACTFFELAKNRRLPAWCISLCPIDDFVKNKAGGKVYSPRAWVGDNILLIGPKYSNKKVTAKFALINGATGVSTVRDVDTQYAVKVFIPMQEYPSLWMIDAIFEVRE